MPNVKKFTVLVVEDERAIGQALKLKLIHEGINAVLLGDGQQALDWLKTNQADLIVLDLVMPKMDGFGFLEAASSQGIKAKIIITSNLSQEEDIEKAKKLGATDFFIKSNTTLKDLVKKIKHAIEG